MRLTMAIIVVTVLFRDGTVAAQEDAAQVEVFDRWQGTFREDGLREQEPELPFIRSEAAWEEVWTAWRPGTEVPEIDFNTQLVLVATVDGPNRLFGPVFLSECGDVRLRLASTRAGGPGFGYLLMRVAREGIVSVNGTTIDQEDEMPAEFITVKIRGQLRTGITAIGGETTGATITASNLTFELYFGDDTILREQADQLNGTTVLVTGRLEGHRGIEVRLRQIVTVESLVSASTDDDADE